MPQSVTIAEISTENLYRKAGPSRTPDTADQFDSEDPIERDLVVNGEQLAENALKALRDFPIHEQIGVLLGLAARQCVAAGIPPRETLEAILARGWIYEHTDDLPDGMLLAALLAGRVPWPEIAQLLPIKWVTP